MDFPGLVIGKVIRVIKGRYMVAFNPDLWEVRGMNEKKLRKFCEEQGIEPDFSKDFFYDERGFVAVRSELDMWFAFLFKVKTEAQKPEPERDFGMGWTHPRYPGLRFRVTWNPNSGELYAQALSPRRNIRISFGFHSESEVEAILSGWADKMLEPGSLKELEEALR